MSESKDHAKVVILPPILYLIGLVVGIAAKLIFGGTLGLNTPLRVVFGVILLASGIAISSAFSRIFASTKQDRNPRTPTPSIITSGLYSYSRNPAYVALTMILLALALLTNNPWLLLTVIPVLAVMHFGVILREEAYLEEKFGDEYRDYKARVRRWI